MQTRHSAQNVDQEYKSFKYLKIMAKDNFDIDSLSKELDNQMSQLDKELNKQMEDISSQVEVTPKKHKYIIRLDGPMMQIDSMELPNATDDCIEEIWEEEGPFVDYVNDDLEALWYDAYDIEIEATPDEIWEEYYK